jgi:hypothetical protein
MPEGFWCWRKGWRFWCWRKGWIKIRGVEKIHQNIQLHSFGRRQMKNKDDDDECAKREIIINREIMNMIIAKCPHQVVNNECTILHLKDLSSGALPLNSSRGVSHLMKWHEQLPQQPPRVHPYSKTVVHLDKHAFSGDSTS